MRTLIRCPFHPPCTAVARKRPPSFCQKCRWQIRPKHAYPHDPTKSDWADYAAVQAQGIKSRNVRNYLCILEGIYQKQYASCLSRWNRFCTSKNSDPLRPAVALVLGCLTKWLDEGLGYSTITRHAVQFLPLHVPAGSPSRGGDVAVHTFYINQPSLPTPFYSVLVSISVFLALSTVSPYVVLCG